MTNIMMVGTLACIALIADGILIIFIFLARRGVSKSAKWLSTPGTVTSATTEMRRSGNGVSSAFPVVRYSYQVAGQTYEADRISHGAEVGGLVAGNTLAKYPVGAQVNVFYDPNSPSDTVLERSEPWYVKWLWVTLVVSNLFLCGFGALMAFILRKIPN